MSTEIAIRKCQKIAEFQACVQLQKDVWKFADIDVVPLRMFVVAEKIGGQIIGCFQKNDLIGFTLSIPGSRNGRSYLHSHMLAVREEFRNQGFGRSMKLAQREDALVRGFDLIEWTFDPLEIKNAYLNIARLGAIVRRYSINQYGDSSSPLQGGLPTDRLVAEWWLRSQRVEDVLARKQLKTEIEQTIEVPAEIYEWKASAKLRSRALAVQSANREKFLQAFQQGLEVLGYELDARGNGRFLLGRKHQSHLQAGMRGDADEIKISPR